MGHSQLSLFILFIRPKHLKQQNFNLCLEASQLKITWAQGFSLWKEEFEERMGKFPIRRLLVGGITPCYIYMVCKLEVRCDFCHEN